MPVTQGMDAAWIWIAAGVPLALALVIALPLWLMGVKDDMGSAAGAAAILACTIGFIAREYGAVEKLTVACLRLNRPCNFQPDPFTRYAIYGGIGMLQVFAIFAVGLVIEERLRRRGRSRTWR